MQLRTTITLVLAVIVSASVGLNYVIQRIAVMPSFRTLEHEDAIKDWQRCENAIKRDLTALSQLCFDWAAWDDTYKYVQDEYPEFYEGNLANPQWFIDQSMDVLFLCQPDGTVYWSHVAEIEEGVPTTLAWLPQDRLPTDHPLMQVKSDKNSKVDGIVRTELGFVMLSARPILTSDYLGPKAGVLIFGRRISEERVAKLREQTGVTFELLDAESATLSETDRAGVTDLLAAGMPIEELVDANQITVRGLLKDLNGNPSVLIRTEGDRKISQQGAASLLFATWSLTVAGLVTLVTLLIVMRKLIIQPLSMLTNHAVRIGESGMLTEQLIMNRSDEIGTLARSLNRMLDQLAEFRAGTAKMSRQAGMAEVAAGILHNVGNAMTNVCVLAESVGAKLAKTRVTNLTKVSGLLEQHRDDLPGFFADEQPGAKIPEYLTELSKQLHGENESLRRDMTGLQEGLQHVKEIVASHQGLATSSNFDETISMTDFVRSTVPLLEASFQRHGVRVETVFDSDLKVRCDRSKLSQVMVNLMTNAKESLAGAKTPNGCVQIHVGFGPEGFARIEVSDNGPGVSPENIERLFSKGFSTKPDGHGIGLHYCWLAIREMRGSLSFVEPETSEGTTFRIDLPLDQAKKRAAA